MRSPWKKLQELDPEREYVALISDIPPKRMSSTGRLFRGSSAVKRQLATTEGVMGFSLEAKPVAKQYRTLSVWTSEDALATFARAHAHGLLMKELGADMAPTTFIRWTFSGRQGRPSWADGVRRLREATSAS